MDNEHLDQFKILEKIGEGGMGPVYRARHKSLDKIVALKLLAVDQRSKEKDNIIPPSVFDR